LKSNKMSDTHHVHHQEVYNDETLHETSANNFCTNEHGSMAMYMDGFHFTFSSTTIYYSEANDTPPPLRPCINLYFPGWTLYNRERFVFAMVVVFTLGVMVEFLAVWRVNYLNMVTKTNKNVQSIEKRVKIVMTLCYTLQALMGYILMLATMTYSLELLICTCTGLCVGYYNFSSPILNKAHSANQCFGLLKKRED